MESEMRTMWNAHYCDNCRYEKLPMREYPCNVCSIGDDKWEEAEDHGKDD